MEVVDYGSKFLTFGGVNDKVSDSTGLYVMISISGGGDTEIVSEGKRWFNGRRTGASWFGSGEIDLRRTE